MPPPAAVTAVLPSCPDGWSLVDTTCYLLGTDAMTADEAITFCDGESGISLELESQAELDALGAKIAADGRGSDQFWLGITDAAVEGEWLLQSSSSPLSFTNWHSGSNEPNGGTGSACARMVNDGSWVFKDIECTNAGFFPLCKQGKKH